MGLEDILECRLLGLDTAPFVYYIEERQPYLAILEKIFEHIDRGGLMAVTSALTLLEVTVVPFRLNNFALANQYEALLTRSRGLICRELDRPLMLAAARLRAVTQMKTPDAIQVAAALASEASIFLTNDRRLPTVPGLKVVQLTDLCHPIRE